MDQATFGSVNYKLPARKSQNEKLLCTQLKKQRQLSGYNQKFA